MKSYAHFVVMAVVFFFVQTTWAEDREKMADNSECLRCHAMSTLAYLDPTIGGIVDLSVDPVQYGDSNHADLACQKCHHADYNRYPHPPELRRQEALYCLECHKENENPRLKRYRFSKIENEFEKSIHHQKKPDYFDCFSCHDPHKFEVTQREEETFEVVRRDNAICLQCHASQHRIASLTDRIFSDLLVSHRWLPKIEFHWKSVRCIECHTPHQGRVSHTILEAGNAEQSCVICHTRDSLLLTKLYKHRSQEARQQAGFINSVVLNDAYIVGMTRNWILDGLSIALTIMTLAGLGVHGTARWIVARKESKQKRENEKKQEEKKQEEKEQEKTS